MLHLSQSNFLEPTSLAKLQIQPRRITPKVRLEGTETIGMTLCASAASKDKYQPVILAVTQIVTLNQKRIHLHALAVVTVGQQHRSASVGCQLTEEQENGESQRISFEHPWLKKKNKINLH